MKRYLAGVLLAIGFIAWLAWPKQDGKTTGEVTPPAVAVPPPEPTVAEPPVKAKPAAKPRPPIVLATFSAKHKHRFQDCEGVLTFTANTIRYQTDHPEDSFMYSIKQVELDDDGVKDRSGKAWHFTAEGRDMEDIFKRWKTGVLRAQNTR
jgi:hypothetical protein